MKKTILVITDGIGYNPSNIYNAFATAKKPAYDYLFENVPFGYVKTSGLAVGLPDGQMGNSEVGHQTIGCGMVLYQNLVKITKAIEENSIGEIEEFKNFLNSSKDIHIVGLLSDGGVHSHIEHIIGIAKIISRAGKQVFFHTITDGRDVSPVCAANYFDILDKNLDENMKIATICGRFYAMDRDNRWERVESAYKAIAKGESKISLKAQEYIKASYEKGVNDEFLEPATFGEFCGIQDGDGVLFANFRSDRMRQMVSAIANPNFDKFETKKINLNILTATQYDPSFDYPVLFKSSNPQNTLSSTISKAGLTQLHTAETEKYAHVTFFFNGGVEEPVLNETRILIPSPKVKTYDEKPQMSAPQVGEVVLRAMDDGYDFIVVNFANGDMVGHTGVFEAGVRAVEAVDAQIGLIVEKAKQKNYSLILTSDHGNVEEMRDANGDILTNHTTYDVFCFVMDERVREVQNGGLSNIAPTILKLIGIEKPKEMDEPLVNF